MEDKCTKCSSPLNGGSVRFEGGNIYAFCKFCTALLKKRYTNIVHDFMNDKILLTEEEHSMLNARIMRKDGKMLWSKCDNKGQDDGMVG